MKTDIAAGKWKQIKGQIKARWGGLTDDEIEHIAGRREEFVGVMQEQYGKSREQAEKAFDEFRDQLH